MRPLLVLLAVSLPLAACNTTKPVPQPSSYRNTNTSATTATHNEENPPPPDTRSADRQGIR